MESWWTREQTLKLSAADSLKSMNLLIKTFFSCHLHIHLISWLVHLAALRRPNHPRLNSPSPLRSCLKSSEREALCVRAAGNGGWSWWYSCTLPQGEREAPVWKWLLWKCVCRVSCNNLSPPPHHWWLAGYWLSRNWTHKPVTAWSARPHIKCGSLGESRAEGGYKMWVKYLWGAFFFCSLCL